MDISHNFWIPVTFVKIIAYSIATSTPTSCYIFKKEHAKFLSAACNQTWIDISQLTRVSLVYLSAAYAVQYSCVHHLVFIFYSKLLLYFNWQIKSHCKLGQNVKCYCLVSYGFAFYCLQVIGKNLLTWTLDYVDKKIFHTFFSSKVIIYSWSGRGANLAQLTFILKEERWWD